MPYTIRLTDVSGSVSAAHAPSPLPQGGWFVGRSHGDTVAARVAPGSLTGLRFFYLDILLDSFWFANFGISLKAGERGIFTSWFSPLTQCQTRGAFSVGSVDLAAVDQVVLMLGRKIESEVRFCAGPVVFTETEPPRLTDPLLPRGPLLDEFGQSTFHDWPGRTRSTDELIERLYAHVEAAPTERFPASFSRWGGWSGRRIERSGFFRTHHDGRRWWLVDPDGHLFWSSGVDCVHPTIDHETRYQTRHMNLEKALAWMPDRAGRFGSVYHRNPYHSSDDSEINYLQSNFIRAFGPEAWQARWADAAFGLLRRLGFNTAGDWSDEAAARRARFPYVRPLELFMAFRRTPLVAGSFPDVFDPRLDEDAARFAGSLEETKDDPALIGYFLTNEPAWNMPAATMLQQTRRCSSRRALADFLRGRHQSDERLCSAWGIRTSFAEIAEGEPLTAIPDCATADLADFSTIMLERLLTALNRACRRVDPNHLDLGVRWPSFPPQWALRAMGGFDVISFNCYRPRVERINYEIGTEEPGIDELCKALDRPFLVGEWHFGALDGGLPSAGLYRVKDQEERGRAFRFYQEQATALPWCVGAHWFNFYDRNALYCTSSNENCNIGFYDICHQAHEPICRAAREVHERLYALASGEARPFDEPIEYVFPSR